VHETLIDLLYILNRYVHIICTTVIVGGTLFFELIVPVATGELKTEQQLAVFGRARWSFKVVVISCAILLVLSGIVSTYRLWNAYSGADQVPQRVPIDAPEPLRTAGSDIRRPGWWWAAHASTGVLALVVAVSMMTVRRPPDYPLYWMRLSLTILMVVIFLAVTARHMRLSHLESERSRYVVRE
jgi:putative copper export protein